MGGNRLHSGTIQAVQDNRERFDDYLVVFWRTAEAAGCPRSASRGFEVHLGVPEWHFSDLEPQPELGFCEFLLAHCEQVRRHSIWNRKLQAPAMLAAKYEAQVTAATQPTLSLFDLEPSA